ncbi:MAG: type 1 periplasmic-binding domain-containing protein [Mycobacteriales bacterium]
MSVQRSISQVQAAVVALSLLALAGCGSTVALSGSTSEGAGAGLAASGPAGLAPAQSGSGASGSSGAMSAGTGPAGSINAAGAAIAGAEGATAATSGGPGPTSIDGIPATGRGWTKTTVYIGVTTQQDVQKAAAAVGLNNLNAGDQQAEAQAIANAINRSGGIFGRKLQLIFQDVSTTAAAENPDSTGQTVCTYYTQDRPVIALISPVTLMDVASFRACMARGKVPLFSATVNSYDAALGQALAPYWYQLMAPDWDQLAPVLVHELLREGWFGGWNPQTGSPAPGRAKVGIFYTDDTTGTQVMNLIKSALAAAGYTNTVTFGNSPNSTSGYSPAVLRFESDGVTHVIVPDANLLAFQLNANNQHYMPRYGVNTANSPETLLADSPPGQNNGALGVGWAPTFDVSNASSYSDTPGAKQCLAWEAQNGQTYAGKPLAEIVSFAYCDGMRLIAQGAVQGGGLTPTDLFAGVLRISSDFPTAVSFASGLGTNRLYVPGAVRDLAYSPGCSCYQYASSTNEQL